MLAALAEAGRRLDREDWLDAAARSREFLLGPLSDGGRLHRTWRDGVAKGTGYLEDYADVAHGLLRAARRDRRPALAAESRRLALLAVELFADERARRLLPHAGRRRALVAPQKDLDDNPTPSGNSMLAFVLLRLARLWGDDELERRAVGVLRLVRDAIPRAPPAFGRALCALDLHLSPPRELAIVGDPDERRSRARRSPASRRTRSSPSGPATACRCSRARTSSAAGGRLRLRALRLPSAGNGSGASCR